MQTSLIAVMLFSTLTSSTFGQGAMYFDSSNNSNPSASATSSGLVFNFYPNSPLGLYLDTNTDINAELLCGTSPSNVTNPVVTLLLSSSDYGTGNSAIGQILSAQGDITTFENGTLYDPSGQYYVIPNVAAGETAYFQVLAWTGDYSNYIEANNVIDGSSQTATTVVFPEVLESTNSALKTDIDNMPALILVYPWYSVSAPTASTIYLGQSLSNSVLSGGSVTDPFNDVNPGDFAFAFVNPALIPPLGTNYELVNVTNILLIFGHVSLSVQVPVTVVLPPAPSIQGARTLGNGFFYFTFTNYPYTTFRVLVTTNVSFPLNQWSNLGPAVESPVGSGQFQFTDPQATTSGQRFYRVSSP